MKKIKVFILCVMVLFVACGCSFGEQILEKPTIYVTIYPIQYIINYLYGENSTVLSIYPNDVVMNGYELTDKQIQNYSRGDLFVYIGLGGELDVAKKLINENDDLLIIDAAYGLNYNYAIEEMWLSPNNFLMLSKNIHNSLIEYLDNSYLAEGVNSKYDELYENVSWIDAELRSIGKEATSNGNNVIVVSSNVFYYLENYGFKIISLEELDESNSENAISDIKSKFKNSTYSKILMLSSEENTELITELVDNYGAEIVTINALYSNTETASDYITIQYENIASIREYF